MDYCNTIICGRKREKTTIKIRPRKEGITIFDHKNKSLNDILIFRKISYAKVARNDASNSMALGGGSPPATSL